MPTMTIKAARVNAGLRQTEAAEKLGISTDQLYNWETGRSQPKPSDVKKITELYGVTFEQLNFLP